VYLSQHPLLSSHSILLFLNETILYPFDLSSHWIQLVIMIFYTIFPFFINHVLELVPISAIFPILSLTFSRDWPSIVLSRTLPPH